MTITTDADRVLHTANGVTTVFSTAPIEKVNADNVRVSLIDPAGVEDPQTLGVDYSLVSAGVQFGVAPPAGDTVLIQRVVDLLQPDQYQTNAPFPAAVTENRFDQVVMALQQVSARARRSIQFHPTDASDAGVLPPKAARANTALGFDAAGNMILQAGTLGDTPVSVFGADLVVAADAPAARALLGASSVGSAVFTAADATAARGALGVPHFFPTAATRAGIQAAVDLATAAGGGVVLLDNLDYVLDTTPISITGSHVKLRGSGKTRLVAPADGNVDLVRVEGTAGSATTLSANVAANASTLSLTTAAGFAVGQAGYIRRDASPISHFHMFEVIGIAGDTITITPPMPLGVNTGDTHQVVPVTPVRGVAVQNIRFSGGGNLNTVRGVRTVYTQDTELERLQFDGFPVAALYADFGLNNTVRAITTRDCGSASESDITLRAQTGMTASGIRSVFARGFGPKIMFGSYNAVHDVQSHRAQGRGIKIQGVLRSTFNALQGHASASTGIAVTEGTVECYLSHLVAVGNGSGTGNDVGLWFSDQSNSLNYVDGALLVGNPTADLFIGATDLNNVFRAMRYGTITNNAGASSVIEQITASVVQNIAGDVLISPGGWNSPGLARLGPYRLWVDGSGRLRIKNGAPTSDGDGVVVGTQA